MTMRPNPRVGMPSITARVRTIAPLQLASAASASALARPRPLLAPPMSAARTPVDAEVRTRR